MLTFPIEYPRNRAKQVVAYVMYRTRKMEIFPVVIHIPVNWGDQDALGHVNNTFYLRWCESSRVEYLARVGLWQMVETDGIGPILANINCNYRQVITYPDTVLVGSRVTHIGNTSIRMEHQIVSRASGVVAAEVDSTIVVMNYRQKQPVPVPDGIRKAIQIVENGAVLEQI